jgi:benzoate membrane transport protein
MLNHALWNSGGYTARSEAFSTGFPVRNWFRLSAISAGFIAVLVGYTSSAAIVFQAASAAGATTAQLNSWMWALGIGMGVTCLAYSLYYKHPILTAWSTPGAALLAVSLVNVDMPDAIGIFLFSSLLLLISGVTGWFHAITRRVPATIASAMLAGILTRFGLDLFIAMQTQWVMVGLMFAGLLLSRIWMPRYAIAITLLIGILYAQAKGMLHTELLDWSPARPLWVTPSFSLSALIGVGIPLFIVNMTSQNLPGLAVLRANGYQTPVSPLMAGNGIIGILLAPFGGYAFGVAAITAAICMSKEADPDPAKRYIASSWAGLFYLFVGVFGATVVGLFAAFPAELVAAIAGLALLGTIGNSLAAAVADEKGREAAIVTYLATASGMSFMSVGSAFWGLLFGIAMHYLAQWLRNRKIAA